MIPINFEKWTSIFFRWKDTENIEIIIPNKDNKPLLPNEDEYVILFWNFIYATTGKKDLYIKSFSMEEINLSGEVKELEKDISYEIIKLAEKIVESNKVVYLLKDNVNIIPEKI